MRNSHIFKAAFINIDNEIEHTHTSFINKTEKKHYAHIRLADKTQKNCHTFKPLFISPEKTFRAHINLTYN